MTEPQNLRIAIGWKEDPAIGPSFSRPDDRWTIQITNSSQKYAALTLVLLLVIGFVWIARKTDALRDTSLPSWWQRAKSLRASLALAPDPQTVDTLLGTEYPNFYKPENKNEYRTAARDVLERKPLPAGEKPETIIIGLSLLEEGWRPIRAAYSLGRVQLGVWFLFAVATGVFLWVVYGQLPALDGSILALLGLSVATTGMSFAADRNAGNRPYTPTQGFWWDITTGFDDKQQIHRYQAVAVNILLLLVGIWHVLHQLTYPVFEETWLIFLGVSGATLAAGKVFTENPRPVSSSGSTTST